MSTEEQCDALKWVRLKIHSGGMVDKPIVYVGRRCALVNIAEVSQLFRFRFHVDDRISHLQHVCDTKQ